MRNDHLDNLFNLVTIDNTNGNSSYYYGYEAGYLNFTSRIGDRTDHWAQNNGSCNHYLYAMGYEDGEGDRLREVDDRQNQTSQILKQTGLRYV